MAVVAPVVSAPAPYEVSFGHVIGRVGAGTERVYVTVEGRVLADKPVGGRRFDLKVDLPRRDVAVRVTAVGGDRRATTVIAPVFGLPRAAEPRGPPPRARRDLKLTGSVRGLAGGYPGAAGAFVRNLGTGREAGADARVQFPAASTLKVAIAIEVLRTLPGKPIHGGPLDRTMRKAIIPSDDEAANQLLVWIGGSTSGGAARVNATMHAIGMSQTDMYGGYLIQGVRPSFVGKRTTARDLAVLMESLHLAAAGRGKLARRGRLTPSEARFLLYLLAHTQVSRVDRFLPAGDTTTLQKAGWISKARHDAGLVYWRGGVYVVVVLTWNANGVGDSSDVLAGRIGRAAYLRFRSS